MFERTMSVAMTARKKIRKSIGGGSSNRNPHQGARERARRKRQMARGIIPKGNG